MEAPDCTFCRIASGVLPSLQVWQDEDFVAFLDRNPIREGHLQLIPRAHFVFFDDLPDELAGRLIVAAKVLAKRLKAVFQVSRVGFVFSGWDVPHCHAHLIPLHVNTDVTSLRYFDTNGLQPKVDRHPNLHELEAVAAKLR